MTKYIEHTGYRGSTEVTVYETQVMNLKARMASDILIRGLALIAADADGEDSAGRQKLRMLNPSELAGRACDLADCMFTQFNHRQWLVDLPDLKPAEPRGGAAHEPAKKDDAK